MSQAYPPQWKLSLPVVEVLQLDDLKGSFQHKPFYGDVSQSDIKGKEKKISSSHVPAGREQQQDKGQRCQAESLPARHKVLLEPGMLDRGLCYLQV